MSKSVLSVENVTMQFGGVVAVDNLNLEVNEGEIVALIGPNGAGKTTAFNVITGVYAPSNGRVSFKGNCIVRNHPSGKMKKQYKGEHADMYTAQFAPEEALDDEALYGLLMRRPRPEVLLCSNNHLALHCLQYIRRIGLKVPQDIALLTFDNYPFSMLTDPAITAVEVDMHDMGINAARFVLQRIRKPNLQTQSYCTSPCILEREST